MIHHLKGNIVERTPSYLVIECSGVGYMVNISLNTFSQITSDQQLIYTHFVVREDAQVLYGFVQKEERMLFLKLISVSGVGASTAQMMLSAYNPQEIVGAIINEDVNFLKSIKGIGAKTAQRVIVDLKDKLEKEDLPVEIFATAHNTSKDEALSALIALGFDRKVSNKVLEKIMTNSPDLKVEELVKSALKSL